MSQIVIGTSEGKRVVLPSDLVTSTLVVYGGKGMGKTNFGSVLVEELSKAGLRWSYLDPLGVAWGLRHSADGRGAGVECVILGGAHGDIPIEPTGGAVVADLVVDEDSSVIIDFSRKPNGEMWTIGEKVRFVTEYTRRLFQRQGGLVNGHRREPLFQILDEAARYVPQVIPHGNPQLSECLSAWETLVEEGRNVGIGVGLLTQRSARMAKSVSEVADAMFSFRIVGPNSIDAVMDWLGEHVPKERIKAHIETLRQLERGRCLLVSPGWMRFEGVVDIRARETFDSSATPKPGERQKRVTGEGAKPDLDKYSARMKETIERVQANDPAKLKARVQQLEKELRQKSQILIPPAGSKNTVPDPRVIQRAVDSAIAETTNAYRPALASLRRKLTQILNAIQTLPDALDSAIATVELALEQTVSGEEIQKGTQSLPKVEDPRRGAIPSNPRPIIPQRQPVEASGDLTRPQMRVLAALAEFAAIGIHAPSRSMVASWLGVKAGTGSFKNYLSELRTRGLIADTASNCIRLTEDGTAAAPEIKAAITTEDLLARSASVLGNTAAKILRIIHDADPEFVSRESIAEQLGLSADTGSFKNYISEMRTAGMIQDGANKTLKASDWLFI